MLLQLKSDDRPPHVVTLLMQELSANDENDWAEHLVGEMVEGAPYFKHSPDAMHMLKESLALACLSKEFVEQQLGVGNTVKPQQAVVIATVLAKPGSDCAALRQRHHRHAA